MIDIDALSGWFEKERRDLPWRENPSFYRVWVSEVMLQQTQAVVVAPYFERWMEKFPTIEALAAASEEEVIKVWEGLGYYSRARNLLAGAHKLARLGHIPQDESLLLKIKGLGPYTRGAIRSFAWRQKAVAVDGNVTRVISRFYLIEDEVEKAAAKKIIEKIVFSLLPDSEPWLIMEALIELGALVCQKVPQCMCCPLRESCRGYQSGVASSLPNKGKRVATLSITRHVTILMAGEDVLVKKTVLGKVMAGLYEFPYLEDDSEENLLEGFGFKGRLCARLPPVKQTFTRYRATLFPTLYRVKKAAAPKGFEWRSFKELSTLPFSSGHRKILNQGLDEYFTY